MIIDLANGKQKDLTCEVAVVGAGAVGAVVAAELSRNGVDVILLEGGGEAIETVSQNLNEASVVGRPMTGLENARFRMMGGSTNFWGGQIYRFAQNIFEPRPWLGSAGWPFSRDHLDPYYDRAARLLGLTDDFTDAEIWSRVGEVPLDLGPDLEFFLTRTLTNRSTAHIFKSDIRGNRLRTLIHANVTGLITDGATSRVVGLEARSLDGASVQVAAKYVVLACGTIENIRLLLHPLSDGRNAPWGTNPWLGRGFNDHIEVFAGKVELTDKDRFHKAFDNIYFDKVKYLPRIKTSPAKQEENKMLDVAGVFVFRSAYKEDLANFKLFVRSLMSGRRPDNIAKLPSHLLAIWKVAIPLAVRYIKSRRGYNPTDGGIDFFLLSEQWPNPESSISLVNERNALGMQKIAVNWSFDGREIDTMASFAEAVAAAFERTGIARIEINPKLAARDPAFLDDAQDYYHQMGGTRIGPSCEEGVVDADLKVYGANGLYVGGASVYPSPGFGNPTYTAMAMGVRLADHLMGKLR